MNLFLVAEQAAEVTKAAEKAAETTKQSPTFWETAAENIVYLLVFFGIIVAMFVIAFVLEKLFTKSNAGSEKEKFFTTKKMAVIGVLSAMAAVLMVLDFPIPFIPGSIYKFDFSELPVMIGAFAYGPATGVVMEFMKILIKLLIKGTSTAFIGELANFVVGCSFIIPAAVIYFNNKTKKRAIIACVVATVSITVFSMIFNWLYLIPAFIKFFTEQGRTTTMADIVKLGTKANSMISDETTFILLATGPFNLLKGIAVSIVTMVVYKPLSRFMKSKGQNK